MSVRLALRIPQDSRFLGRLVAHGSDSGLLFREAFQSIESIEHPRRFIQLELWPAGVEKPLSVMLV